LILFCCPFVVAVEFLFRQVEGFCITLPSGKLT
jgi:hypothetical protein